MVSTHWAFYPHGKSPWYTFDIHWIGDWVGPTFGLHFLKYAYFICSSPFSLNGALWPSRLRGVNFECGRGRGFLSCGLKLRPIRFYRNTLKLRVMFYVKWEIVGQNGKSEILVGWKSDFFSTGTVANNCMDFALFAPICLSLFKCHCDRFHVTTLRKAWAGRNMILLSMVTFRQSDSS